MKVEALMTTDVRTTRPHDSLDVPARLMWDCDVGVVPVVDEENHIVGIITDRDICMAACHQGLPLREIEVQRAMSADVVSVTPTATLAQAEELMREHQIRRLPVCDAQGTLVGILSLNDLSNRADSKGKSVPVKEVAATLQGVSAPRQRAEAA